MSELAAARWIKAEPQADWSEFVQCEQIAISTLSEEWQAVLAKGEMTATQIAAEVARKADLVSEINTLLDKASQRFGPDGMAAIRGVEGTSCARVCPASGSTTWSWSPSSTSG